MNSRIIKIVVLLNITISSGCIVPYRAHPTLDYTPTLKVEAPAAEVHAFRVDGVQATHDVIFGVPSEETFSRISVSNRDEVPRQVKGSFTHGLLMFFVALNYKSYHGHTLAVRVYRPGYELVEVKSWELNQRVVWKPVVNLYGQEQVLDALFPIEQLAKREQDEKHKDALRFGASEYERLSFVSTDPEQRSILIAKATELRLKTQ